MTSPAPKGRQVISTAVLAALFLMAAPFAIYALRSGLDGFSGVTQQARFLVPDAPLCNWLIFGHMVLGGWITLQVPFQLWAWPRRKWPAVHRASGYVLLCASLLTGVFGLGYILGRGTIGGPAMNLGFAVYGVFMIGAAVMTLRAARARRFAGHRRWALRLFVLAMGSWLYRVHYGIWYAATGGAASNDAFTGTFDLVQNFAFYLPYLLLLEGWFMWERKRT
ncbi:MAG: DUF2306 domain-containing protein [Roseobacter sp.]